MPPKKVARLLLAPSDGYDADDDADDVRRTPRFFNNGAPFSDNQIQ
jgi:hypothetical protein